MNKKHLGINYPNLSETRMVVALRLLLALSALVIVYIDPTEPARFVFTTYLSLSLYVVYSAGFYLLFLRGNKYIDSLLPHAHWLDIGWYITLVGLSSGTNSVFFFLFFFAILHASFAWGFETGIKVTIVSAILFTLTGYFSSLDGENFHLNRFLLRPVQLIVLGYMIAYWGGFEIKTKRRLELLKEIVVRSNPRFGVDRTLGIVIEILKDFYRADDCILIMNDLDKEESVIYTSQDAENQSPGTQISFDSHMIKTHFSIPDSCAIVYGRKDSWLDFRQNISYSKDLTNDKTDVLDERELEEIAEKLDARSFISVPISQHKMMVGRIFVLAQAGRNFEASDIDFLTQTAGQFMPVVENIRLVDHLASYAAEDERKTIARDIHDSIIQPYIGLQYGIDSIVQLLDEDDSEGLDKKERIEHRIRKLKQLTETGISDLRSYIRGLSKPRGFESSLYPAIKRYAVNFTKATGLHVEIDISSDIHIADRLAADLFQIVTEGLSNIRRHTHSTNALISISTAGNAVFLTIENETDGDASVNFSPRSISERVELLGGVTETNHDHGKTVIRIEIPL